MNETFWKDKLPKDIPQTIDSHQYESILSVFNDSCRKFSNKIAFTNLGYSLIFKELDHLSANFAAYLQNETTLKPGDRIAIQLPNVLQYPIVLFGAMRAGLVVVNTNPLYTDTEIEHQFNDSGAKGLVVLANMAHVVQEVITRTPVENVIITELADVLPQPKRFIINSVVKYIKKMVPAYSLPNSVQFTKALKLGEKYTMKEATPKGEDVAVLQYTGGTTGVAKGAMLTHTNIVSNMLQVQAMLGADLKEGSEIMIAPLPLYHIYSFTVSCLGMIKSGNNCVLITNPRDIPGFVKELEAFNGKFSYFVGLNTLFVALCNDEDFKGLDFSALHNTVSGGMALQKAVAERWQEVTGCQIGEGYGMTEASPVVTVNPPSAVKLGTIGLPVPSTELKVIDDEGNDLPIGEAGELCCRGPQVMKGYWQRPDATAKTITEDGWLKTGDVAVIMEDGYSKIVDRKKDMIIVSGFNVYPNELEDVLVTHPDVLECAAVGIPDETTGEQIKIFVVTNNSGLSVEDVRSFMRERLTAYKVPKMVEFRDDLPKTNVGKILRRELRDQEVVAA